MKYELKTLEDYSDEALLSELRRAAEALHGVRLTKAKFASIARVHSSTIEKRFGTWGSALEKAGILDANTPSSKKLTREAVLNEIRKVAAEHPGKSITEREVSKNLQVYRGAIVRQFGKWEDLLSEVGLMPSPLGRRYTETECFENILVLWAHYGRQPKFGELKHPPSTVGPKAYILRWGGWRAALSAFVKQVNEPAAFITEPTISDPTQKFQESDVSEAPPRSILLSLRYKVLCRDNFRCVICGASPAKDVSVELHVDHIFPWSRGGMNVEENLRALCSKCNLGKGDKIEDTQQLVAGRRP